MPRKKSKKKQPEKPKTTPQRMSAMVKAYAETCNIVKSAELAGIDRRTHYKWMANEKYPRYAEVFRATKQSAVDYLKSVAVERATEGWLEPVHYQGRKCGNVRRYDGGLLQFLLRGMAPEEFGNKQEISGPAGTPIQAKIEVVFVRPEPSQ